MTVVITGSAGFIGFHLAQALLSAGETVVGLDNYNDYYFPGLKRARDSLLRRHDRYTSVELDLTDFDGLSELCAGNEPELVIHLAAQAGVRYSITHPFAYQQSNLQGFLNVLELCRQRRIPKLVYASSSSVYGGLSELPYHEGQRTDMPVSLYAATKKANELMAHTYSHLYGLQTVGLRFFTVYGPWGRPDMAYWSFTERILADEPIQVYNYGKMQRDFTYIDDIVDGILKVRRASTLPLSAVYNIGNHRSENLLDFIGEIETALGKSARKELLPLQPGDVLATYASVDALRDATGYEPTTPISEGIPKFVEWYLANPELTSQVRAFRQSQR